ncbi:MAG: hypothetical protein JOZ29_11265 [Deltaproteobacteria bacterium]|nr:hypothetical protein [Deltaproteobacteria bacterium]
MIALISPILGIMADAASPPKMPSMVRWVDPTEHAFSLNVPGGWRISGGTHRISPIDAQTYVRAQSPDGKISVFINDPNILPRQEPHPAYYSMGWYEGRVVQSPAGPLLIERFLSGARFAEEYIRQRVCMTPHMLSVFNLPSENKRLAYAIAPAAARAGVRSMPSAGEIVYRCGDRFGYTSAVNILAYTTIYGPHTWAVYKLGGYLSNKSEVITARYVMNAMDASFAMNPSWQAQYDRQIHDTTGALIEMSNRITQESIYQAQQSLQQNIALVRGRQRQIDQMSGMSMGSFNRQQQSQAQISQRWSDITLGQIHGCDDLGNCGEVSNDYQNYWTKNGRTVVGGPSDGSPPGPEYHKWTPDY